MFRLLGVLGGLSGAMDLGSGAPLDASLIRCVLAGRLARVLGCGDEEVRTVLYTALLEHLGCTAAAPESVRAFGDDISLVRFNYLADMSRPLDVVRTLVPGVSAAAGRSRIGTLLTVIRTATDVMAPTATCEVARDAARRLGLPGDVDRSLASVTAMWDGRSAPAVAGAEIPLATRITHVADTAALFLGTAGVPAALEQVGARAGRQLDPDLAAALTPDLLEGLDEVDPHRAVLDLEPDPVRLIDDAALATVARTLGDLVDLKNPWLHGHSAAVAELAGAAADHLRLPGADRVRLAGHLHDLGRIGVSGRVWAKPGPLSAAERDQARLHLYYSERILSRVPELGDIAALAAQHHERCDGSGYHRGLRSPDLSLAARVVAAADRYRTDVEGRPHRDALPPEAATANLAAHARAGRLDPDAVGAVLRAAGQRETASRTGVAGLTDRQVEVLRLLARGLSNREIADRLHISSRTAEHHVQDIYTRIGASTRPAAALFAMGHGLLERPW
ncbi:HD domain-containing protein [Occultella glacieicola]|uniref:HD domain-containing protein n=1 Tax=Occultella glacieicola TaxID=2518684 RepID=A0ABY2E454_9MICO|nr:HD domain-containing phosphohydrolase [Occultella glacieicola]TDE89996.1 HD domain-containing protein [Occultella glacieicola]